MRQVFVTLVLLLLYLLPASAQEIEARITLNHQQVEGTSTAVFDNLKQSLTEFVNTRQWTQLQFRPKERIQVAFNFTVQKYEESSSTFETTLSVTATRPVYNSSYTTTLFATRDGNCKFRFQEFDKLEFRLENLDNELTAIIAYYCYLIIGLDLDAMSPKGGTDVLQQAQTLCGNAQSLTLSSQGWKAYADGKNRYAIINDYLDGAMEPLRLMHYKYYREGLDVMAENPERARAAITESFELMQKAIEAKSLSELPQLITEYKGDEIVNIYQGKATAKEKDFLVPLLSRINASKNGTWNKLRN
ncbi:MAG: DUF4835 family protein [Bacteroidales bacterium]|nr:DUF4835 family protein [Bacteroidales bacterium]